MPLGSARYIDLVAPLEIPEHSRARSRRGKEQDGGLPARFNGLTKNKGVLTPLRLPILLFPRPKGAWLCPSEKRYLVPRPRSAVHRDNKVTRQIAAAHLS
jgi:hypothetical protein